MKREFLNYLIEQWEEAKTDLATMISVDTFPSDDAARGHQQLHLATHEREKAVDNAIDLYLKYHQG